MQRRKESNLSIQQERFCQLIAQGFSQGESYKKAYNSECSKISARVMGGRLIKDPDVKAYIEKLAQGAESNAVMTITEAQEKLSSFARRESQEGDDGNILPTVQEAIKAIEVLIRSQGGFIEKRQVDVNGSIPVVIKDDVHD